MLSLKTSADIYLEEAEELLKEGNKDEACRKYYHAALEAIKILAYSYEDLRNRDLNNIAELVFAVAEKEGKWIISTWGGAVALITANLDIEVIKDYVEDIKKLVKIADERFNSKILSRS